MTLVRQLLLLTVCAVVASIVAGAVAMALIPQLSLEATIRGVTIAIMSMIGTRIATYYYLRRKNRG